MRRLFLFVVAGAVLSGCGALKKTKKIDRVMTSAEIEVKLDARSDSNVKVEDKSVKEEKVSEKSSDDIITEREIFFDDSGRVSYIKEKVVESRKRNMEKESRDSLDRKEDSNVSSSIKLDSSSKSKTDSLKKDSDLSQPENSVWSWIGGGILAVCAAIAIVIFVRFRK